MIAELQTIHELAAEHGDQFALVVNHSGGKDSMRMLGLVGEEFPDSATYVVMADTGFEHHKPVAASDWTRQRCRDFGLPLTVVSNPKRNYLEMVAERGKFPSAQFRQCTSDLKRGPIEKFIRRLPHKVIINCLGIRAEESRSRAKLSPLKANNSLTTFQRTVYDWLPIFNLRLADLLAWHWANGVPLHPVYVPEYHADGTAGGYLRRFSCRICIFSSDTDLVNIQQRDPEAFETIAALEDKIGFTMRPDASLVQIVTRKRSEMDEEDRQQELCFAD